MATKKFKTGPLFEPPTAIARDFEEIATDIRSGRITVPENVKSGIEPVLSCLSNQGWSLPSQEQLVRSWLKQGDRPDLQAELLCQWIRFHAVDDYEAVADCIELIPPAEVSIIGREHKKGSQKIVYRANWRIQQRTVILKRLIDKSILVRELRSHPFSANHPNIVKTYTTSSMGEVFLIEERLDEVLNDEFRTTGLEETARLTHDVASALDCIHQLSLVHGDVKPDNIGRHEGRFILLDFGICRPADQFAKDSSATGSLRTRGPELLLGEGIHSIQSDLWALGATVASAACGRFPLVEPGETVPRITSAEARREFEEILQHRVKEEYNTRIDTILDVAGDPRLTRILRRLLSRDPSQRGTPAELLKSIRVEFGYALPQPPTPAAWGGSPADELEVLQATWSTADAMRRLPPHRLRSFIARLEELQGRLRSGPTERSAGLDDLLNLARLVQKSP